MFAICLDLLSSIPNVVEEVELPRIGQQFSFLEDAGRDDDDSSDGEDSLSDDEELMSDDEDLTSDDEDLRSDGDEDTLNQELPHLVSRLSNTVGCELE